MNRAQFFLRLLGLALLLVCSANAQEPKRSLHRFTIDTGWLARAHWTTAAFDEATTGYSVSACQELRGFHCSERNPLARPFIGSGSNRARLGIAWAAESFAVSAIPNRRLRRIVQVSAILGHLYFGSRNIDNWHAYRRR